MQKIELTAFYKKIYSKPKNNYKKKFKNTYPCKL